MGYTIYPALPDYAFNICDYADPDRPRKKQIDANEPQESSDFFIVSMAVVMSEAMAISGGNDKQGEHYTVCSSPSFRPVDTVEWEIIFYSNPCTDITVKIL